MISAHKICPRNAISLLYCLIFLTLFSSVSFAEETKQVAQPKSSQEVMKNFCGKLNARIKEYYWGRIICNPKTWTWDEKFISPKGYPLVYKDFKFEPVLTTTLFLCGVHGDELPSIYQCIHMVRDVLFDNRKDYKKTRVVIAPLVNPDSFFADPPTRQNSNGVDINRNFPTSDFEKLALSSWKTKYNSDKRKFPGHKAGSEIETQFQMMLIDRFKPDKIITIHSPFGWLDIDAPTGVKRGDEPDGYYFQTVFAKSRDVALQMSRKSNNYPLINFRVYPGSLGNYAAKERNIPTYTLELPTSGAHKAHTYWKLIRKALVTAIHYQIYSHK